MYEYFIGEIILFAGNYVPQGWLVCDGRLLSIAQYQALYSLIGVTYGGDGTTNFALPDLRGRLPIHRSPEILLGSKGGEEVVNLTLDHLPSHNHVVNGTTSAASSPSPQGLPAKAEANAYLSLDSTGSMSPAAVSNVVGAGSTTPHSNMQPYLCLNFIICLDGIYPS
jgi:microcystin-dependent protein